MSGGDGSFSHVSFHVGGDWRAYCHAYGDRTPILSVEAGDSAVSFSLAGRRAGKAAVEFARALACEVQLFAAEVERLHAAQAGDSDGGNDGDGEDAHGSAA